MITDSQSLYKLRSSFVRESYRHDAPGWDTILHQPTDTFSQNPSLARTRARDQTRRLSNGMTNG